MIDWTKPVQTRDGRRVRVLCTDMNGNYDRIVGLITRDDGTEAPLSWRADGAFMVGCCKTDLINVPAKRVVWVNMYPNYRCDDRAKTNRIAGPSREAFIRVEYEIGQFDEEE